MFNLNENNRIVMSQHPSDMRIGVDGMCGQVRRVGLDPTNGDVYVFVGKSRKVMKLLHWERGGYVMYCKRLEQGRFHPGIFLSQGIGFRSMRWDKLVLLMEGISPKVARRHRFERVVNNNTQDYRGLQKRKRGNPFRKFLFGQFVRLIGTLLVKTDKLDKNVVLL